MHQKDSHAGLICNTQYYSLILPLPVTAKHWVVKFQEMSKG